MNTKNAFSTFNNTCKTALCVLCSVFVIGGISVADAAVVSRGRAPVAAQRTAPRTATSEPETATVATAVESAPVESGAATAKSAAKSAIADITQSVDDSEMIIVDKTNQFSEFLSDETESISASSDSDLAKKIREQRAALDTASATAAVSQQISAAANGRNMCDANLRACMQEKCGQDYSKCAGDTDTLWGDKMDACRRDLPCTGHEYTLFAAEIKADRDMNARIASYNSIVDCGNQYNDCVITECGVKFDKCLGKKAGDTAISKCEKIARNCREQDSGLASRMMNVFGTLRQDAEKQVQRDVERLYELRDLMRGACNRLGAMFDERSLDCVYSVEFRAGEKNTLFASKKLYAGDTFNCDQNWFGIDITTFKENAYRATREQKSATSALLGSGVGTAAGAISSGVIDRAIDRHKAERAVKKAEKENAKADKAIDKATKQEKEDTSDTTASDESTPATPTDTKTGGGKNEVKSDTKSDSLSGHINDEKTIAGTTITNKDGTKTTLHGNVMKDSAKEAVGKSLSDTGMQRMNDRLTANPPKLASRSSGGGSSSGSSSSAGNSGGSSSGSSGSGGSSSSGSNSGSSTK